MISKSFQELADIVQGRVMNTAMTGRMFSGVAIDSRTIRRDELFIAIRGQNNDGHDYIAEAIRKGCAGVLVCHGYADADTLAEEYPVVVVDDTHQAMIVLASHYRDESKAKFIVITGSNGKTTTKELVYSIIRLRTSRVYRSPGNLNNLYGLPLALFKISLDAEYAVLELGISIPGEMTRLAGIARPDLALITNVGPTHLETLVSVSGVAEAKFELVDHMPGKAVAVINADDPLIVDAARKRNRKFVTYGIVSPADFMAEHAGISAAGFPVIKIDGQAIETKLFGSHQAYNLLAAYAAVRSLGLEVEPPELNDLDYSVEQYRGDIERVDDLTIIADCYNANPVSMKSGLKSFKSYLDNLDSRAGRGIAVIGDMLELGAESEKYHKEIGDMISGLRFDMIVTVGPLSRSINQAALKAGVDNNIIWQFDNAGQAGNFILKNIRRGDIIYLKASRGIGLERIITAIKGTAFRQN